MSKSDTRQEYRIAASQGIKKVEAEKSIFNDGKEYSVAVYMRIANGDTAQVSSFEMQKEVYKDYISRQKNWRLVDIYGDFGVSGTSLNRVQFNRMMNDCTNGEKGINLIITRSVSRLSRNLVDAIGTIEKLSSLNPPVGIYFEIENLYSLDSEHRNIIDLLNSVAWAGGTKCKII